MFKMIAVLFVGLLAPVATLADEIQSSPSIGILVSPGDLASAKQYYQRISTKLGVADTEADLADLNRLLVHFGLDRAIDTAALESAPSADLMAGAGNQLIVSRFFAPKIVDFNSPTGDAAYPYKAGWRKLVRLAAGAGSAADKAGLGAAYLLFNFVQAGKDDDPFASGVESFNTQVIIVPKTFAPGVEDAIFFLDYDTRGNGYKLIYALNAAFDTHIPPEQSKRDYFVPVACGQCHGHDAESGLDHNGTYPFAKVNYLDTDHWYDIQRYGDFPSTPADLVLYDGGPDHASQQYLQAFDVFRKLNGFIEQQNIASARPSGEDEFKLKAVRKWNELHETNSEPIAPIDRALAIGDGSVVWQASSDDDKHALDLLNRYCFRCHSSVIYSVFDKSTVVDLQRSIVRRVQLDPKLTSHMPQGRILDAAVIADLVDYVQRLKE